MRPQPLSNDTCLYRRITVLTTNRFSEKLRSLQIKYFRKARVPAMLTSYHALTVGCQKKVGKKKYVPDESKRAEFFARLRNAKPDFIIVQDAVALYYLTGKHSLHLCRGCVYAWEGIPVFVLVPIVQVVMRGNVYTPWVMLKDLHKLRRWLYGEQRPQPRFRYQVCRTLAEVEAAKESAATCLCLAIDVETIGAGYTATISCTGIAGWHRDGSISVWVIPWYTGHSEGGKPFWPSADVEARVRTEVAALLDNSVPKVMQNGLYDSTYFVRENMPVRNWWLDTAVAFHAVWQQAPKRLDFIASICCDYVQYWKDEGKSVENAKEDVKVGTLPTTEKGMERYWRYNALDCYYTLVSVPPIMSLIAKQDWALINYKKEIRQFTGPSLAMSTRGIRVNHAIKTKLEFDNHAESAEQLEILRTMVATPEFNPNSNQQVAELLYDVLGAKALPRKGKTVDEKVLKVIQTQHPLIARIVEQIWATKKPANNVSKYGSSLRLYNDRLLFTLNSTGTKNARYSSKNSNLHVGTQIQNVPYAIRVMLEADPGYVLFERDYAQSDGYFTAFHADEEAYIANLTGDKDAHCVHAAEFFRRKYEDIYAGYVAEEPWVVDSTKGVRQITKRVTYGANYLMMAYTLFITMGRQSVVAAAQQLGYDKAGNWDLKRCVKFCEYLLWVYFNKLYRGLRPWIETEIKTAIRHNNRATCIGGYTRTFFGDMAKDDTVHRDLAAFFGQSGTACNINEALENIYYSDWEKRGGILLFQVHDSIIGQVPIDKLELIEEVGGMMANERVAPSGKKFVVPSEAKVGIGWGKRMMPFTPGITFAEIKAHDDAWQAKFFAVEE